MDLLLPLHNMSVPILQSSQFSQHLLNNPWTYQFLLRLFSLISHDYIPQMGNCIADTTLLQN